MPLNIPPISWPKIYNMVNLGGIDLATANGSEVPGIYQKITDALTSDHIEVFYNWKFADIVLPPSKVVIDVSVANQYTINEEILVKSDDTVGIIGFIRIPIIVPLTAEENRVYDIPTGADGFGPVTVDVPIPTPSLVSLNVTENGVYHPATGEDGFYEVTVNVPDIPPVLSEITITENGTYTPQAGVDGFSVVNSIVNDKNSLPNAYQQVEYLEFSGTQYLVWNTGYLGGKCIETVFSPTLSGSEMAVAGNGEASAVANRVEIYVSSGGLVKHGYNSVYGLVATPSSVAYSSDTSPTAVSGTKYGTEAYYANTLPSLVDFLYIGGKYNENYTYPYYGKIYSMRVYSDFQKTSLMAEVVPCYRKNDNTPGFYDLIKREFLTNQGTGSLVAGPDIN